MKNIFNVYVEMESQEQCDRMKQLCVDNGLPIWEDYSAFDFLKDYVFGYNKTEFFIYDLMDNWNKQTQVTETEFIELLKQYKDV